MRLQALERFIRTGSLHLHRPDGRCEVVGQGEPSAHLYLHSSGSLARMLRKPEISVGEAYVEGEWSPGPEGLLPLFELYFNNQHVPRTGLGLWLARAWRFVNELNGLRASRRNVQHHYDLDAELFRRFLDRDLHYSCAYFEQPNMSLDAAQQAKCEHIARKLCLSGDERVLDIGSGWGGLALYLARTRGVHVTGLTLSDDQHRESCRRARAAGLEQRLRFFKQDYREHEGAYDAIVSVGMFEHVGRPQYPVFFDKARALLAPGGRMLLHNIGRSGPPASNRTWISRYIFPGGYIPALSEASAPMERSGLVLADLEIWRRHYAFTLREWNRRFQAEREHFRARLGERFCRMWEYYLQTCEAAFTWGDLVVFQFQIALANDTVPRTRDYLYHHEQGPVSLKRTG